MRYQSTEVRAPRVSELVLNAVHFRTGRYYFSSDEDRGEIVCAVRGTDPADLYGVCIIMEPVEESA